MGQPSDELQSHIASLRRYARALAGNPADADDLVQESLQKALVYLRSGREIKHMRSYLFTILHNVRVSRLRKESNFSGQVPLDSVADFLSVPANQAHRAELEALMAALDELAEEQRQVVLLICLEGFSYREAATIMGVPIGTVMSRLARARKALLEKMSAETPKPSPLKRVK